MYKLYYIVNSETSAVYIGVTRNTLNKRLNSHKHKARSGAPGILYNAMRKYGEECFSILLVSVFDSEYEMFEAEKREIANARKGGWRLYNTTNGGEGGFCVPAANKAAWREKLTKSRQGGQPFLGKRHSEETKKKCSNASKKRWEGKTYPTKDILTLSYKEAKGKYGISKTHYYRLRRAGAE